jgi:hypothetical protein
MQDFVRDSGTTIDVWYEILNTKDFYDIDLTKTTHGNELASVRFFTLKELSQYDVRPKNLEAIL